MVLICSLASCSSVQQTSYPSQVYDVIEAIEVVPFGASPETSEHVLEVAEEVATIPSGELLETEDTEPLQLEKAEEQITETSEKTETLTESKPEEPTAESAETILESTTIPELLEEISSEQLTPTTETTENINIEEPAETQAEAPVQAETLTETQKTESNKKEAGENLSPLELLKIALFIAIGIALVIAISKIASRIYEKKHPEEVQDNSLLENFIFGNVQIIEPERRQED